LTYRFDDLKLDLDYDVFPPSLNGNDGLIRMHWRKYMEVRDQWQNRIWYNLSLEQRQFFQQHHFIQCVITYTRRTTHRTGMDWVNLAASVKIPEDALVRCGILSDDNPNVVQYELPHQVHVQHRNQQGIHLHIIGTVVPKINKVSYGCKQ
jgi:hypothetical protein